MSSSVTHLDAWISVTGENRIDLYALDRSAARLERRAAFDLDAPPGALALHPAGQVLYAARRDPHGIASLRVERDGDGLRLVELNRFDVDGNVSFLTTDRAGRFLLWSSYKGAGVGVHRLDGDGAAHADDGRWTPTATGAHSVRTTPNDRFALVPHVGESNQLRLFAFDGDSGALTPADESVPAAGTGPRHLAFHPRYPELVYCVAEQGNTVLLYRVDADAGRLTHLQTASTLPAGFSETSHGAELRVHPSGHLLFASNRGHDSLARFALDDDGGMTLLGHTSAEATPRAFDLSPAGDLLVAAGQAAGRAAVYRVDAGSGELTRTQTVDTGAQTWWVLLAGGA